MSADVIPTEKKATIFIVEDDSFLLDMYSLKFSKNTPFTVSVADNGETALKKIREGFIPDVLLMDVIMPGITGIEVLETIRKEKLIPKTTIIMLTNQSLPEDIRRSKDLNVDGYIVKAMAIPSEVCAEVEKIYNNKNHGL